jgi:hypothetical protein
MLARIAVVAVLAGSLMGMVSSPAHAAGLTPRKCMTILTGDKVRRLDVCARGWVSSDGKTTRAVVEMHTYALLGGINDWVDSTSQSITIEQAKLYGTSAAILQVWGQVAPEKCRVNGPGGTVGCSVPNTARVAFYGPAHTITSGGAHRFYSSVEHVSWRDDRGLAHTWNHFAPPEPDPLDSPVWPA